MDAQLNPLLEAAVKEGKIPGIGAIILDRSGNTLYKNAVGTTNSDDPSAASFTSSALMHLMSCTKIVVSIAALQLLEQGKFALDDPVEKYVPSIRHIQVHDGVDENGKLKLRPPKTKMTVLHLMTHTAGFTYDFFRQPSLQYRLEAGQPPAQYVNGKMYMFETPLYHDPGTAYEYGVNTDWLGFVVEAISGLSLGQYIEKYICEPLGLKNTKAWDKHSDESRKSALAIHLRNKEDGKLIAAPTFVPPMVVDKDGGGTFLFSSLDDYSQILLTLLNNGTNPISGGKLLESSTVQKYLFADFIPQTCSNQNLGRISCSIPTFTNTGNFLPGTEKGWSCGLMVNLEDTKYGRKALSGAWAGLGNLYYWIDPTTGILGLFMTSVLPFVDRDSLEVFDAMEKVAYGTKLDGKMSNFELDPQVVVE